MVVYRCNPVVQINLLTLIIYIGINYKDLLRRDPLHCMLHSTLVPRPPLFLFFGLHSHRCGREPERTQQRRLSSSINIDTTPIHLPLTLNGSPLKESFNSPRNFPSSRSSVYFLCTGALGWQLSRTSSIFGHVLIKVVQCFDDAVITFIRQEK